MRSIDASTPCSVICRRSTARRRSTSGSCTRRAPSSAGSRAASPTAKTSASASRTSRRSAKCSGSSIASASRSRRSAVPFPEHIARVLDDYRVPAETKAALFDLYVSMGEEVLEVFSEIAEGVASASLLTPEDTLPIRERVVERYLTRNHPLWLDGKPTPSFWHPRALEGRASGL